MLKNVSLTKRYDINYSGYRTNIEFFTPRDTTSCHETLGDDKDTYDKLTRYCLGEDFDVGAAATNIADLILTDTRSGLNISNTPDSSEYSQVHLKGTDNQHYVFTIDWNNP
jgi:hypothetical protein